MWLPSENYQKIVMANKLFYEKNAKNYDQTETCVVDNRFQDELFYDLKSIKEILEKEFDPPIKVLDACGGSGNVALKLLDLGMEGWLCDQSEELIDIFTKKCTDKGYESRFILSEIGHYLANTQERYDMIVFSSALHHLEDYESVLLLALNRLNKKGVIFTVFDPVKRVFPAKQIMGIEYILFKFLNDYKDFIPAALRRINKVFSSSKSCGEIIDIKKENIGELAEWHAIKGIDDDQLVSKLKLYQAEIIWHKKLCKSRYTFFEMLLNFFGCKTSFKLLVRKSE